MKNPASAKRKQGSSKIASLAAGDYVDTLNSRAWQQIIAARRLVARFGLARRPEVETDLILKSEGDTLLLPSAQWVAVVRQIVPGVRLRVITQSIGRDAADSDTDEALARWAYEQLVKPGSYAHEQERQMRAALAKTEAPE